MGTNYYLTGRAVACAACGHTTEPERLHIGKSSMGWVFSLHVTPELPSLDAWLERLRSYDGVIVDEYESELSLEKLVDIITKRGAPDRDFEKKPWGYESWEAFHSANESEPGPNGLIRSKINRWCIGHGDGTWSLHPGEFS
jgi:hypothetical protein